MTTDTPTDRRSVSARETVCVPKEVLDVLLIAADWAEARIEARENPLRLALINIRAALDASAPTGAGLTAGEVEAVDWAARWVESEIDAAVAITGASPGFTASARGRLQTLRALVARSRP